MKGKIVEHYTAEFFARKPELRGQLVKIKAEAARRGMFPDDRRLRVDADNFILEITSAQARLLAECLIEAADYLEPR